MIGQQKILSKNQIKYASHDVIFLFDLKKKLHEMLKREDRLEISEKYFLFTNES